LLLSSPRPIQRSQSLREQTYQVLRSAILSGEFLAGSRLVETQIAEKLQVRRQKNKMDFWILHDFSTVHLL